MTRTSTGRSLLRLAVVGAVATGAPLALAGTASAAPDSAWDKLAQCESGGNWSINSGNGYYGGIQFNASTWHAFGGAGLPHQASRSEQIAVAERTLAAQGWNAWPACSRKMGLRGHSADPDNTAAPDGEEGLGPREGHEDIRRRLRRQARRHPQQDRQGARHVGEGTHRRRTA
jgi:hypothetical protein